MAKIFPILSLIAIFCVAVQSKDPRIYRDLEVYRIPGYFGKKVDGPPPKDNPKVVPFKVNIPKSVLKDLKYRLDNARFLDHLDDTENSYGFSSALLANVTQYWRTKYNWRSEEKKLNGYPNFKTQIEGLNIHFVHVKAKKTAKTIVPLLVCHGWPGSVFEYYKALEYLIEPDENGLAYEVVIPSIPGFGYSEMPKQKGVTAIVVSRIYTALMVRLGLNKFMVHGGDWGNILTRHVSLLFPDHVIGTHILGNWDTFKVVNSANQLINTLFAEHLPNLYFGFKNARHEFLKVFPLMKTFHFIAEESGYYHFLGTKPDTYGAAVFDSPVGLAALILEKFSSGTNADYRNREDGGLTEKFTLDELLTTVMLYWTSGNPHSTLRWYKENVVLGNQINTVLQHQIRTPSGTVDAPHEFIRTPRALVEDNYENLVQYTEMPRGGHFFAMEEPKLTVDDIRSLTRLIFEQFPESFNGTIKA